MVKGFLGAIARGAFCLKYDFQKTALQFFLVDLTFIWLDFPE
jgi:hypothetical protein